MDEKNFNKIKYVLESDSAFKTLGLSYPLLNFKNKPIWNVLNDDITKQFKKLSLFIHPDKNQNSEESKTAFKKLKEAHDDLKDFKKRAECIKSYIAKNTHPKLGFIPEHLKNSSREDLASFRAKDRKRSKRLNLEHFNLYKDEMKKQFYDRRVKAQLKKSEKEYQEKIELKKTKDYFAKISKNKKTTEKKENCNNSQAKYTQEEIDSVRLSNNQNNLAFFSMKKTESVVDSNCEFDLIMKKIKSKRLKSRVC